MSRISPHRGYRLARLVTRLAFMALPAALIVGCGGDDDSPAPVATATAVRTATATVASTATRTATQTSAPPTQTSVSTATQTVAPPTQTPVSTATSTPNAGAGAACAKLADCGQCFIDSNGQCIANEACAARLSGDAATCVNSTTGCDATGLGDCLFLGCQGTDATGECQ
jgi:hypothetical protein